jgi:pimeloyl-ACP methyl ester carboxylesterase
MPEVAMNPLRSRPWISTAVLVCLSLLLDSCTPLVPYRIRSDTQANCAPKNTRADAKSDDLGIVDAACDNLIHEVAAASLPKDGGYGLHFVEFDDQGRLFSNIAENGVAASQMDNFLSDVRSPATSADGRLELTSVVVFVHGWKHNAQSWDNNVRWFRVMLDRLAVVEANSTCRRRVIGLYVGWRGDATPLPDLVKDATFWTRKKAAGRVADGQVREVFARLRSIQDIRNEQWNGLVESSRRHPDAAKVTRDDLACKKSMRLTIVGHSFGGLIAFNALGPSLVRDIADLNERIRNAKDSTVDPVLAREGDLIVTINPAVEAATFVPLSLAAKAANPKTYHAPVFVSITSADDSATGIAFPAARFFNTLFNKYPNGGEGERAAALKTIGHDEQFVDYRLDTISDLNAGKSPPDLVADPVCESLRNTTDFSIRFDAEMRRLHAFGEALDANPDANTLQQFFPRQFCIHANADQRDVALALMPRPDVNLNSPVWNVYTKTPVLDSHSDLLNPMLIDFLRQMYEEGTRPETTRLIGAP